MIYSACVNNAANPGTGSQPAACLSSCALGPPARRGVPLTRSARRSGEVRHPDVRIVDRPGQRDIPTPKASAHLGTLGVLQPPPWTRHDRHRGAPKPSSTIWPPGSFPGCARALKWSQRHARLKDLGPGQCCSTCSPPRDPRSAAPPRPRVTASSNAPRRADNAYRCACSRVGDRRRADQALIARAMFRTTDDV